MKFFKIWALPCPSFPWSLCFLGVFLAAKFLGLFGVLCLFSGFLRVRMARKILGVSGVFLGIFEKTKEKKDRVWVTEPNRTGATLFEVKLARKDS